MLRTMLVVAIGWVATLLPQVARAAPTAPSGLGTANIKATSLTLTWSASTGGTGGIAGYDVYRDGTLSGTTTTRSLAITGLAPLRVYSVLVIARDAAGAVSPASAALSVTTAADTTDPAKPADLSASNVTPATFALSWTTSTDNVGVTGYNIYRAGVLAGSTTTGTTFTVSGLAPDTNHNMTVKAADAAGNLSAASAALVVRTLAESPSAPTGLSTTNLKATSFTLKWAAATGGTGGIAGYDIYQGGALIGSTTTAKNFVVTGLAPSTAYSMTVRSRDSAGNVSAPSAALLVTTTADVSKPTRPTGLVATNITTNSFTLSWTASTDGIGVVSYQVYRAGQLAGTTTATTLAVSGLAPDTNHSMTVKAADAAGNLSAASAALLVKTLADPPSVPAGLSTANLKATFFTLKWTASTGGSGGIAGYDIYQGGALIGSTTTAKNFVVTGLAPSTAYSMTVRSRDSLGTTSAQSAPLLVTTTADTTAPTKPGNLAAASVTSTSFTLNWTASIDDVGVTGYKIYRGGVLLGSSPATTFDVTGLMLGTAYRMTVKAVDAAGHLSAASTALVVTTSTNANQLPSVSLTAPADGATFTLPATLTLSATATDNDGTVAKVEFFNGATKLGEATVPGAPNSFTFPLTLASPGTYLLMATATDNQGGTGISFSITITVSAVATSLPFLANFEPGEGYLPGPLDGQKGWSVTGPAHVVTSPVYAGQQAVAVAPGTPPALLVRAFVNTDPSVVFVDLFAQPAAAATPDDGVFFETDAVRVALSGSSSAGILQAYNGDGVGGGVWLFSDKGPVIDATGLSANWLRLTARSDYAAKKWDLYLDGQMIAADLGFLGNAPAAFAGLGLSGHATVTTGFDDLLVAFDNPLFVDADHDGMDDAWEIAHGLNPAVNDRDADPDADGLSNIQEYVLGTDPLNLDTDGDGIPDKTEVLAGTNPLVNNAAGDLDHDGVSNLVEYQQGRSLTKGAVSDTTGAINLRVYSPSR